MRQAVAALGLAMLGTVLPAGEPARVDALAWMAGTWQGTDQGMAMEEVWLAPAGGAMLGLHRDVAHGRMASFEFLRIEESERGLVYLSQPRGRPATPFHAVEVSGKRVVFENPAHDFPQRIVYWLAEDGALHARIEGKDKGKEAAMEWRWTRVRGES
ncbi:MAG TPA: DUF6265 family protein [Candidatus Polarisedimenticolaceae bacterium]|nr:DUF6265 family protein [Candidatus Polarisedimenticolaceae bacterium]